MLISDGHLRPGLDANGREERYTKWADLGRDVKPADALERDQKSHSTGS